MGIVERLREGVFGSDQTKTDELLDFYMVHAADLIERLRGYAAHTDECAINGWLPRGDEPCPPCTCGLTALIKEIEGE